MTCSRPVLIPVTKRSAWEKDLVCLIEFTVTSKVFETGKCFCSLYGNANQSNRFSTTATSSFITSGHCCTWGQNRRQSHLFRTPVILCLIFPLKCIIGVL